MLCLGLGVKVLNTIKNDTINEEIRNSNHVEEEDMEQITIHVIKILLQKGVPLEDIQHISGKSIEEIKRISEMTD